MEANEIQGFITDVDLQGDVPIATVRLPLTLEECRKISYLMRVKYSVTVNLPATPDELRNRLSKRLRDFVDHTAGLKSFDVVAIERAANIIDRVKRSQQ